MYVLAYAAVIGGRLPGPISRNIKNHLEVCMNRYFDIAPEVQGITDGGSLASNTQLVHNNVRLAAKTAVELTKLK